MILNHLVSRPRASWAAVLIMAAGCTGTATNDAVDGPGNAKLVPVKGVVTLNGEPLSGAVVTFLPKQWAPGVGETNEKGEYSLSTSGQPGTAPGDYKVAISLLLSAEGEPQGLGPRSSLAQPPGMLSAKEFLPREYADLGSTQLTAHIDDAGGSFDFEVKAPGLVIPPRPAADATPAEPPAEAKPPAEAPPATEVKPDAPAKPDAAPDTAEKNPAKQ